jgi:hypothetical protein
MTSQEFITSGDTTCNREGFSNFTWTTEAIDGWEGVWFLLWELGVKWEWQNSDRYARRYGDKFNLFAVHNDAVRLDMAVPLPEIATIRRMANWLLGAHIDNATATEAGHLMRKWILTYVE